MANCKEDDLPLFKTEQEVYELYTKHGQQLIIYKDVVYDVSEFLQKHPAGAQIIEEHLGTNIEEPFEEENHSGYAKKIMSQLPKVGYINEKPIAYGEKNYKGDTSATPKNTINIKQFVKKLISKEDPLFIHKSLGLFALFSFTYRYAYVLPTTGTLGFDGHWFDHLTMVLHMLLAVSSLIFDVMRHRILSKPTIIWQEYRLHAINFTAGCIIVYSFAILWPLEDCLITRIALFCCRISIHLVADEITRRYGPDDPKQTTVRTGDKGVAWVKKLLLFYSYYQFMSVGVHLIPHTRLADLGYNSLIAIQSSAFLMTLVRKGLIRQIYHAFWYTTALVIGFIYIHIAWPGYWMWIKVAGVFALRVNFGLSKYLIWIIYAIFSLPVCEDLFWEKWNSMFELNFNSSTAMYWDLAYSNMTTVSLFMVFAGAIYMRFSSSLEKK